MAYTLISFVGTGIKKDGEYQSTRYVFPDKKEFETKKFAEALLELEYRNFSKVIFLGTTTSAWEMFAEGNDDLCMKLMEARSDKSFSEELKKELENYLSEKLHIPVVIKYHTDRIDEDTSLEIFNLYSSIVPEITDENILVDITHSFRSMPIMLYQAMQFSVSQNEKIKNVELVYGEYRANACKNSF